MNKLILGVVLGFILIIIGGMMLAYSNYILNTEYAYTPNCYQLYPYHYNNVTGTYNYSSAYDSCEANTTIVSNKASLDSSLLSIPGWGLVFAGGISFIISLALLLVSVYKDRNTSTSKTKK
jgi:hypothetical protein